MLKKIGHLSIFLSFFLSFSFPGLTQDCLYLSPYSSHINPLYFVAPMQCSRSGKALGIGELLASAYSASATLDQSYHI